jgi:hypothetical protein
MWSVTSAVGQEIAEGALTVPIEKGILVALPDEKQARIAGLDCSRRCAGPLVHSGPSVDAIR